MSHKIMTLKDLQSSLALLTTQFSRKDRPFWTALIGISKSFNFMVHEIVVPEIVVPEIMVPEIMVHEIMVHESWTVQFHL